MAETILFDLPVPGPTEAQAYRLNWHDSSDGNIWEDANDTVLISDLETDAATGKLIWLNQNSDPAKYHTIRSESAGGTINSMGPVIPPRYEVGLCELYVDLRDFGLQPVAGVKFKAMVKSKTIATSIVANLPPQFETDATGVARVLVASGLVVEVSTNLIGKTLTADTTGKTFLNLSTLL